MENACNGCQNKHKNTNESVNSGANHVCKCGSHDKPKKINADIDQVAAVPGDQANTTAGQWQSLSEQDKEELKARIIESIKDLPPMPTRRD